MWLFYSKHILLQLENLVKITGKIYPQCRETLFCHFTANLNGTIWGTIFDLLKNY